MDFTKAGKGSKIRDFFNPSRNYRFNFKIVRLFRWQVVKVKTGCSFSVPDVTDPNIGVLATAVLVLLQWSELSTVLLLLKNEIPLLVLVNTDHTWLI